MENIEELYKKEKEISKYINYKKELSYLVKIYSFLSVFLFLLSIHIITSLMQTGFRNIIDILNLFSITFSFLYVVYQLFKIFSLRKEKQKDLKEFIERSMTIIDENKKSISEIFKQRKHKHNKYDFEENYKKITTNKKAKMDEKIMFVCKVKSAIYIDSLNK